MNQIKQLLIVNPIASGHYLSEEFKKYGVKTLALFTYDMSKISNYFLPDETWFDQQIFLKTSNIRDIIKSLGNKEFDYVINGTEASLELTEQLSRHYTPNYSNDPVEYKNRCDKYEMHLCLAEHNLGHIKQSIVRLNHFKKNISKFPLFIKPLGGVCSSGAQKLNSNEDYKKYLSKLQNIIENNSTHQTDNNSGKFIISEYIVGDEYLIDTFSSRGQHFLSSIQKYTRHFFEDGTQIPRYCDLITDKNIIKLVFDYICECLNATGFNNGFAHSEVFITKDQKPKLIEINPRVSGAKGYVNKLAQYSGSHSQIDLLMNKIFGIQVITSDIKLGYWRRIYLYRVNSQNLSLIKKNIVSVVETVLFNEPQNDDKTVNSLINLNAIVICYNKSKESLELDTQKILNFDIIE